MGREASTPRTEVGPKLAELAHAQWGVVTTRQLAALGMSATSVHRAQLEGRLHRVHRGVYAVGHARLAYPGRLLAAVLACGAGAVLSHRSAAMWWDLLRTDRALIDVSVPRTRGARAGIDVHRPRCLTSHDTTTHDDIPITTVDRTLTDLRRVVPPHRHERAVAQAERMGLAHAPAARLTRSELEARLLALIRRARLPEPLTNHAMHLPGIGPVELDFFWPAHALVVETDGYESHRTRAAFEADRRRDAALQALGFRVARFTWRDVTAEQAATVALLRRLLTRSPDARRASTARPASESA